MCTLQEAKRFYTLCFSSSFLFNVVIIHHFNTVDSLEMVESGVMKIYTPRKYGHPGFPFSRDFRLSVVIIGTPLSLYYEDAYSADGMVSRQNVQNGQV